MTPNQEKNIEKLNPANHGNAAFSGTVNSLVVPYEFDYREVCETIFAGCKELKDPLSDTQMLAISAALFGAQSALCQKMHNVRGEPRKENGE